MPNNQPFEFDPEDLQRFVQSAGEQLRSTFGQVGRLFEGSERSGMFTGPRTRTDPQPETTGDAGDGVWVIYVADEDGNARIEQLHASELDALRANQHNTDSGRRVRFLPFGMPVSVLDGREETQS